jgi:hypothetical protein
MIFQFNSEEGTGLIMLSDGEKKEFSTLDWVDDANAPKIGLEVSYESSAGPIKIKILSEVEKNQILLDEKRKKEDDTTSFTSMKECQAYFLSKGFEVVENADETVPDKLTMEKFSDGSVQSVSIVLKNFKPEITKKTIHLSSVDEHIKYFQDIGYRLLNDSDDGQLRRATLRRYVMDKHGEIIIKYSDSTITVTQTVNGKKVD